MKLRRLKAVFAAIVMSATCVAGGISVSAEDNIAHWRPTVDTVESDLGISCYGTFDSNYVMYYSNGVGIGFKADYHVVDGEVCVAEVYGVLKNIKESEESVNHFIIPDYVVLPDIFKEELLDYFAETYGATEDQNLVNYSSDAQAAFNSKQAPVTTVHITSDMRSVFEKLGCESITLPATMTDFNMGSSYTDLYDGKNCLTQEGYIVDHIENIYCNSDRYNVDDERGWLVDVETDTIVWCPPYGPNVVDEYGDIIIKNHSVASHAFDGISAVDYSITLHNTVEEIGRLAFRPQTLPESIMVTNATITMNEYIMGYRDLSNIEVYGFANSAAQTFAERYGCTFVDINSDDDNDEPILGPAVSGGRGVLIEGITDSDCLVDVMFDWRMYADEPEVVRISKIYGYVRDINPDTESKTVSLTGNLSLNYPYGGMEHLSEYFKSDKFLEAVKKATGCQDITTIDTSEFTGYGNFPDNGILPVTGCELSADFKNGLNAASCECVLMPDFLNEIAINDDTVACDTVNRFVLSYSTENYSYMTDWNTDYDCEKGIIVSDGNADDDYHIILVAGGYDDIRSEEDMFGEDYKNDDVMIINSRNHNVIIKEHAFSMGVGDNEELILGDKVTEVERNVFNKNSYPKIITVRNKDCVINKNVFANLSETDIANITIRCYENSKIAENANTYGCKIEYINESKQADEMLRYISPTTYGDVNDDGASGISDAVLMSKYCASSKLYPLTPQGLVNADLRTDGSIDTADLSILIEYQIGNIDGSSFGVRVDS